MKKIAKLVARRTVSFLPAPGCHITSRLAVDGGRPVRNIRYRPWPATSSQSLVEWFAHVRPALRNVFLSGVEGLPQSRQKRFSALWAKYCDCRYGLLLPHGTDALRLALASVFDHDGLDYGGEVIVPNLSFIASATAPLDRRFGVAFVDVDPGTLNLDSQRVEEALIPGKTVAIMAVHQFGQPADMTSLRAVAEKHGLKIIEDAAQAHGAVWETGPVGSLGDAAGFSFQSAKNLTCGEGGMLTTNDEIVFERAYSLHDAGRTLDTSGRWEHATLGWNVRSTEYQAALLLHRFGKFKQQQKVRAYNFQALRALLEGTACLRPLDVHPGVRSHGMYMFVMRYRSHNCGGLPLASFLRAVRAEGAPIHRCYTSTMSNQPAMRMISARHPGYMRILPTPIADRSVDEIVYIPSNVFLGTTADMEDVAASVRKVERHYAAESKPG